MEPRTFLGGRKWREHQDGGKVVGKALRQLLEAPLVIRVT